MTVKISVLIDEKLDNFLRLYQAELIKKSKKSISFSDTVNQILKEGVQQIHKKSGRGVIKIV